MDSWFLKSDRRLDTELVDKLILQLNRIYPQVLTDKEATRVRPGQTRPPGSDLYCGNALHIPSEGGSPSKLNTLPGHFIGNPSSAAPPSRCSETVDHLMMNRACFCVASECDKWVPGTWGVSCPPFDVVERLAELLAYLQEKGEEACREFYRALHLHVEDVYFSLPTRLRHRTDSVDPGPSPAPAPAPVAGAADRFVLNDQGPLFFLSCFSAVVGAAVLYYYGDFKAAWGSSRTLGLAALGIGRKVREVLIWYT
ncbi:hypothetical protein NFI96_013753 [Prochilodus magdalenae]|nr:hypothetical protein NFI96_013753 [Prochilodus magdalenae]